MNDPKRFGLILDSRSIMSINPIILVDDDKEDLAFLMDGFKANQLDHLCKCFTSAMEALRYLTTSAIKPSVIISDINMPVMNGIKFKKTLDEDSILRRVPFVFFSTCPDINCKELDSIPCHEKPNNTHDYTQFVERMIKFVISMK